jgi:hypothetical protein
MGASLMLIRLPGPPGPDPGDGPTPVGEWPTKPPRKPSSGVG